MEAHEVRRRVDAELVGQDPTGPMEGAERISLATFAVVREHEQRPQVLAQGMGRQERLEVADGPRRMPPGEQALEPRRLRLEAKLVEPSGLGEERALVGEVGQGRPTPQRKCLVEGHDRQIRIDRQRLLALADQGIETAGVELGRLQPQPIARRLAHDPILADGLAQERNVRLDDAAGRLGRLVVPDEVDEGVAGAPAHWLGR